MSGTLVAACLVIGISDGDTLTVRCEEKIQMKIRLAEIDAPEKNQAFGDRSKQSLSDLCFQARADLDVQSIDRYKRSVAHVTCNGVAVNAEQIKRGMAWVYDRYAKDSSLYAIQDKARQTKAGLWADPSPTPPWEFRRAAKQ